ncbi:hypothetical protein CAPTEDRAFT_189050 [Capitella teleta]|uniref:Uncharacterized protein n=1 Tax=Capitella teleta TaxID=283909 RepID=R7UWD1_CAPTE|nr:hypothetical protein CAPTEDRAFT_189050 [Capitella teleta]|eukprot:ELU07681.1 hypothetical protein CAPTEDRAFT_189050 [Capitella teleta]
MHMVMEQQYAAAKRVKTRCLQLLKLLAQGNVYIQQQLFSKIDFLLKIKGVSFSEIGYTIAQGENSFIDSLCQALMDEFEALEYLIGDNIGLYTKRAILRFYRWVYVNTGANVEDPTSSLRDEKIFVLLEQINNILQQCDKFSESRPETARHLLRLTAAEKPERNDLAWYHSALVFLLDAALPFVEAFLTSCYPRLKVTNERHRVIIARLAESVVMFGRAMDPMISAWAHRKTYARTLRAVFQRTDYKEPQKYLNQYDDEGDINEDFNMFAANVKKIFGGENTVEAQIGYPLKRPYTRFDSDEELPLSPEFQILVQCFIDQRPSLLLHQKYGRAMHLINYFRFSCKITKDKKLREGKENVDMKAMMVLTGLIYNEIIKLPEDWEKKQQKNKVIRKLLKSIKELQNLINSFNAIPSIMLHLSHNSSDDAVRQVLAFLSVMLFNGNPNVQKSLFDYFKSTREERFFITLKAKTQQAAMEIKGIRMVHQKYKSAILDTVESVKMLAHKAGAVVSTLKDKRQSYNRNVTVHVKKMIEVVAKETSKDKIEDCMNTFIREQPDASKVGNLGLILKIMGLMCDGQNRNLQDYFREQSDNFLSCNMVAETSLLLDVLLADVSDFTIVLLGSVLQTLVEFASGNQRNQQVLFDSKVIDFVDYVLQEKRLNECSDMLMLWVKKCIGNLIRVLTEENPSDDGDDSSKVILESLDADSVGRMVSGCFYQSRLYKYTDRQARAWYLEVGFHYFLILCRMIELCHDGNAIKRDFLNTKGNEEVWKYFSNNTMSIEIVKNDKLHRINFPVTCRGALRKKVKESFNYEVDRNPSERIKNFMEWVNEIKDDIAYTRMIYNNIISRTLINRWQYLNTTMIFLSSLQCVLFTACWDADEDDSVKRRIRFRPIDQVPEQRKEHTFIRSHFISVACLWYLVCSSHHSGISYHSNDLSPQSLPFVSVLAMTHDGFFFSYHLLHSAASNQIINRAIRSVTKNGISLLLTLFYALILIYIFTQVHFVFYREMFTDSFCNTMYECFVSVLHVGLIVGPTEGFASPENKPFTYLLGKAAVDLSFFIIISTILLNIVFGIIVDTFAELRDSKGFERHVKQEHNQWAYVFFMLHLDETSTNDYTALELYVSRKLAKEEYDFFPKDRALCLEYIEDQEERKLAILEKKMSYMVQRIKQLEAEVEFEKERSRQEQWEKENKTSKKLLSKQPSVFALIAEAPPSAVIDQPSSSLGDQRYMEALERPQTSILDSRRQANDEVITLEDAESTEEKPK